MAQTFTCANATLAEVSSKIGGASDGDTIIVPPGAATWASSISFSKDIQIIGGGGDAEAGMDMTHATPQVNNGATIITMTNPAGPAFIATYKGTDNMARIAGFVWEFTVAGGGHLFQLLGKSYRRRVGGNVVGGLRVDHNRFKNSADSAPWPIAAGMHVILWGASASGKDSYVTGSFDHNFWDFLPGSSGSEVNSFCSPGSPVSGGRSNGWGEYSWTQDYTYGGGDDTELAVIYIEDNIIHRFGNNLGTLSGGGRFVVRYNASWGGMSGHGIDGGNMGPASWEYHNNFFDDRGTSQPGGYIGLRGGAQILINNRFIGTGGPIAAQTYRQYSSASQALGHASGRNYLDDNWRNDPLTSAQINANPNAPGQAVPDGQTYNAVSVPGDSRQGAIYAQGGPIAAGDLVNSGSPLRTTSARLVGLDGGTVQNRWNGFVIVNTSALTTVSTGDQGTTGPATFNQTQTGYIETSTTGPSCTVTFHGGNGNFLINAGQSWEVRRIKYYLCNPGSGKLPLPTSGLRNAEDHTAGTDTGGFNYPDNPTSPVGAPVNIHKYFSGQIGYGDWATGNRTSNTGATWSNATLGNFDETVMGGKHESLPTNVSNAGYGGSAGVAYPVTPSNPAERRQVGPHWQAPGFDPSKPPNTPWHEGMVAGDAEYPAQAYGLQPYPNPMVSGEVSPPTNPRFTSADHLLAVPGTAISPTFQVATADFAGTVTFSITAGSFGTGTVAMSSSGAITGTPSGAAGDRGVTISATDGVDTKTQSFTLQVRAKPLINITAPTILSYTEPASITFQVNAAAATGFSQSIDNIEYFYAGTPAVSIGVVDGTAGSPYTFPWTSVAAGTYVVTAVATDNLGLATTSSSITITVTAAPTGLAAPTIVVYAGGESGPPSATTATLNFGFSYPNFTGVGGAMTQSQYVGVFAAAMHNPPPYQEWINAGKDIRLLNPAGAYLKHLNVRTLDASFETSEGHPDHLYIQNNHPEWIIRNAAGNTVPLFRPSEQSLDFGNSAYLDWVFGTWMPNSYFDSTEQSAVVTYYEHDNGQIKGMASQFGLACAVGDTVCAQYLTDAGVQTAFKNLFDKFHQYHPNRKIFLSTGLASESQGDLAALEDVLSHADGYYSEYLTNDLAYWNSGTNASKRTILNNTLLLADWCATNDKYFYPVLGQSDVAQPTQAQINYAYAFFNLFRAGVKQFFGFILINGSGQWQPAAIPEMSLPLGSPTETRQQISTNVWRRIFTGAIAYVNISDTSTSITLPAGTWRNSLGTTIPSPLVLTSFSGLTVYA